jgi:hypothetical protein
MHFLLRVTGIDVELAIVVKTDNIGAIFMSQNASTGVRTRYVDTRYHFIRENVEEDTAKINFVRSCDNSSNIFTKNVYFHSTIVRFKPLLQFCAYNPSICYWKICQYCFIVHPKTTSSLHASVNSTYALVFWLISC